MEHVRHARSRGHEATGPNKFREAVDRRQPVLCREFHDPSSVTDSQGVPDYDEPVDSFPGHRGKSAVELARIPDLERLKLHAQRLGRVLHRLRASGVHILWIPEQRHQRSSRHDLFQQFHPFRGVLL